MMTSSIEQPFLSQYPADPELRQRISKILTGTFRAQLLYRIDEIVLFKMLANEDLMMMVDRMVRELADRMENSMSIEVGVTDELKNRVITIGYSDDYGAKQLKWAFTRLVEDPLADVLMKEKDTLRPGCSVTVEYNPSYESLFACPAPASGLV